MFNQASEQLELKRSGKDRILDEAVIWTDGDTKIIVPIGFSTDYASIPNVLKPITSNDDFRIVRPAIVHDYLYRSTQPKQTRKQADKIFYKALRYEGVGWFKAQLMYYGVRIGGRSSFK